MALRKADTQICEPFQIFAHLNILVHEVINLQYYYIERRIVIFSLFAILKIIHLDLVTETPTSVINLLNKIQIEIIRNGKNRTTKKRR